MFLFHSMFIEMSVNMCWTRWHDLNSAIFCDCSKDSFMDESMRNARRKPTAEFDTSAQYEQVCSCKLFSYRKNSKETWDFLLNELHAESSWAWRKRWKLQKWLLEIRNIESLPRYAHAVLFATEFPVERHRVKRNKTPSRFHVII